MRKKISLFLIISVIILQACSEVTSPTAIVESVKPAATAGTAELVTQASVPTAEATSLWFVHRTVPSAGTSDRSIAHDNENSLFFNTKKVKSGDEFYKNKFERPFTSIDMAYLPDLDIVNFSITNDNNFFYIKISLVGLDFSTQSLNAFYGVEIDRNADGRAEILLTTHGPYTADFSADNTAAYLDINGDVGGRNINRPDNFDSDGFEATIFDLNQGVYPEGDPDLVWVRQTMDGELPAIEIAFEKWIFKGGKEAFMWSVLSSQVDINPTILYYHDYFTAEDAGAANSDDPNYPLKNLAAIDNTCRVPLGFQAMGSEPLGCYIKGGEVEKKGTPVADGAKSTCGQFVNLCSRTKDTLLFYISQ